jgi:hypothetical protein
MQLGNALTFSKALRGPFYRELDNISAGKCGNLVNCRLICFMAVHSNHNEDDDSLAGLAAQSFRYSENPLLIMISEPRALCSLFKLCESQEIELIQVALSELSIGNQHQLGYSQSAD